MLSIVPALLMPIVAARTAIGSNANRIFRVALTLSGGVAALVVIVCSLFPGRIVALVTGSAYHAAAPLVAPYALAASALALAGLIVTYEIGAGRPPALLVTIVALAEICVALAYHPSAERLIAIVLCGHAALLVAAVAALWAPHRATSTA